MHLATNDAANALLEKDPLALLIGMLLDQRNVDHRNNEGSETR